MAGELIEIQVKLTSKAHKFLTKRALHLGRDRDIEAGRLLNQKLLELIERQRVHDAGRETSQ